MSHDDIIRQISDTKMHAYETKFNISHSLHFTANKTIVEVMLTK